jgi:hypothetical protein
LILFAVSFDGRAFKFFEYVKKALVCQLVLCRASVTPAKGILKIDPGKRLAFTGTASP